MLIASVAIVVGFIVLIWSADLFVAGAASVAGNLGMPPLLIGLTIVSLGTSAPEVLVSINAALSDTGDLAIGNAIGSNLANLGLVLGVTALVAPLPVHSNRLKREMPILLTITLGCGLLMLDGDLSAVDGLLMLAALTFILIEMINSQVNSPDETTQDHMKQLPDLPLGRAWVSFLIGLVLLSASAKLLVWGAAAAAVGLGVSPLVIGLTVVAIGTSLPELAASVASALKGHGQIALGNVLGSNLFNLLGVMSLPGLFETQVLDPLVLLRDYSSMTGITLLLAVALYASRLRISLGNSTRQMYVGRGLGALLLVTFALYYYWLYLTV